MQIQSVNSVTSFESRHARLNKSFKHRNKIHRKNKMHRNNITTKPKRETVAVLPDSTIKKSKFAKFKDKILEWLSSDIT